jgi:Icc protein
MRKILVLTDLHILAAGGRIGPLDPVVRLRSALDHGLAAMPEAERVVITGDLTHNGQAAEYAVLKDLLAACPIPVHLMIGNHDNREAFRAAFPDAPVTSDGFVQEVVDTGAYRLILLDTVDAAADPRDSGLICLARLDWLRAKLSGAADRRVILFLHHPPMIVGFDAMDEIALRNRLEFLDILRDYPNITQIIAGHVHRTISGSAGGIPCAIFKSPCHQAPLYRPGMDTHASVDEPGAVGVLFLGPEGVVVHTEDVGLPSLELYYG